MNLDSHVYALFDKAANTYTNITVDVSDDTAKRNFAFAVSQSAQLQFFTKWYELRRIADINLQTGFINPLPVSVLVCTGEEVMSHE